MIFDLETEKMLFNFDLSEYHNSDEGQKARKAIQEGAPDEEVRQALDIYWSRRNGEGLTYSNEEARQKGKEFDRYIAELYKEQN